MVEVLTVGDEDPQGVERRELIGTRVRQAASVHQPLSELGVGGKIHP
jgi:hypothetical protein